MNYKLVCMERNERHTRFVIFDRGTPGSVSEKPTRANCGEIVIVNEDLEYFIKHNWNGDVEWRGRYPAGKEE